MQLEPDTKARHHGGVSCPAPQHLRVFRWLLAAWIVLVAAPHAHARDMTGKGGVGLLVTNSAMPMASFRYWRTQLALEVLAGYVASTPVSATAARPDQTNLLVAVGLLYRIADAPKASLSLGLRPWVRYTLTSFGVDERDADNPGEWTVRTIDVSTWRFGAEIPLQAEAFLTDHFGLVGSVGLTMDLGRPLVIGRDHSGTLDRDTSAGVLLGVRGGFSGGLGATYYF